MAGSATESVTQLFTRRATVTTSPRLSVVIVNFCQWQNTSRLTHQLRHAHAVRDGDAIIRLVDNNSPHDAAIRKLRRLPGVSLDRLPQNVGFASAVNAAAKHCESDWLLLLNPDVTVTDGFLDDVLIAAEKLRRTDERIGVVGFHLQDPDGRSQPSAGAFPSFASTLCGLLRPRSRRKCQPIHAEQPIPVDWVTGGCLLVRRDCFQQLRGFDSRYFLYYEDVDFCQRAWANEWSVWYHPALSVTHHTPLHRRDVPAPLRFITRHALLTYAKVHWCTWQSRSLAHVVRLESRFRELIADLHGDLVSAACYRELGVLVNDVANEHHIEMSERIRFVASFLEPIAAAQDSA
jgi:N-acetylglucosaminyl-diphospho-decaprenol L-rhamnosyltransferase